MPREVERQSDRFANSPHEDSAQHRYPEDWQNPIDPGHDNQFGHHEPTAWEGHQSELADNDEHSGYNWGPPPSEHHLHDPGF